MTPTARSGVVARAAATAAPPRPKTTVVPELLHSQTGSLSFEEYTQATSMLQRLAGQASDLELLLQQMQTLNASLDASSLVRDAPGQLGRPELGKQGRP
jgi:hypothetical protein